VTIMLVFVVTIVWSMLWLLDLATAEKSQNFRAMVTERWAIPSQLPFSYAERLRHGAARNPGDIQPLDWMTWQFYGGTLDPATLTRESIIFSIACDPEKLATMMDGLDDLPVGQDAQLHAAIAKLKANRQGIIVGRNHLIATNKRIGERFKLTGIGEYKGIDLEFEIVGVFPAGRYDTLAAFNCDYFNNELDSYPSNHNGQKHPLSERSLNLCG
jgi:putative ABC transport system permease protein